MRLELAVGTVLLACSVFAQARGAWVREAWTWNMEPDNISLHPERVWAWRQSQILAGFFHPPLPRAIPLCVFGARLDLTSPEAKPYLLSGWSGNEGTFRWTDGRTAELVFGLDPIEPLVLEMDLEGFLPPRRVREQRVEIDLNGEILETTRVSRPGTVEISVALPRASLARANRIILHLPDAAFAAPFGLGKDPRQLAVAVHWFRLRRPN